MDKRGALRLEIFSIATGRSGDDNICAWCLSRRV